MAQYLVGLDGGTTGCKTCIFDLDGKLVGSDYREYPSYYPEPGWVEQTTEDLLPNFYDSIKTAINKSGINPEDIIGFGFSSGKLGKDSIILHNAGLFLKTVRSR